MIITSSGLGRLTRITNNKIFDINVILLKCSPSNSIYNAHELIECYKGKANEKSVNRVLLSVIQEVIEIMKLIGKKNIKWIII